MTGLFGGARIKKDHTQVEAYGALDEATCFIGSAYESLSDTRTKELLTDVQLHIYIIMGYLAGAGMDKKKIAAHLVVVDTNIITLEKELPKLTRFILPQGGEAASRLHIARAMIRSAERRVFSCVDQKEEQTDEDIVILQYLNRLSDLFFLLARKFSTNEKQT